MSIVALQTQIKQTTKKLKQTTKKLKQITKKLKQTQTKLKNLKKGKNGKKLRKKNPSQQILKIWYNLKIWHNLNNLNNHMDGYKKFK